MWSPEVFGGIVLTGGGIVLGLRRLGVLDLPLRRNGNNNSRSLRPECKATHEKVASSIDTLEDDRTELRTRADFHKERLDKQDVLIGEIFTKVSNTDTNVGILLERTKKL